MKQQIQIAFYVGALLLVVAMTGCTGGKSKEMNIELIQDMMDQPAVKAQEYDDFFADKSGGARTPPENTAPVGFRPYRFTADLEGAKNNKNPLANDMSDEVLKKGQKFYETHCMVCHGVSLNGDGPIKDKFPTTIPPLNSDKIKGWTDGQIYHVITVGQGIMGAYASHIPQAYRWQVVNYIRFLQKK